MPPTYKYFKDDLSEFTCKETQENGIRPEFIYRLDHLRAACGFPFVITSGYRSVTHSAERSKAVPGGTHSQGIAADIAVSGGRQRMQIVKHAAALGFNGIGVAKHFVHVDMRVGKSVLWSY